MAEATENLALRPFGFCSNAFPAFDFDSLKDQHLPSFAKIHQKVGDPALALDLQLGRPIIEDLPKRGVELKKACEALGLKIGSLNLFPLCDFQADVVKTNVYFPNWFEEERFALTVTGARWVAEVLKPSGPFSISTLAGCYHEEGVVPDEVFEPLAASFSRFAKECETIKLETGCHITLCLEPEPFTSLQKIEDVLKLWKHFTSPASKEHLGINLDCCHFSVMGESPLEAYNTFKSHNIPVPKIHASTALKLKGPLTGEQIDFLKTMDEPRFLHQSSILKDKKISHFQDLGKVFDFLDQAEELYCHFHMPLFLKDESALFATTEKDTMQLLDLLKTNKDIQIYAETYTWSILGEQFAEGPVDGITRELVFLKEFLNS